MNKKNCSIIISIINCTLFITTIIYLMVVKLTEKDAQDIFNMNIESIVEVKASKEKIGENFGTGVIYDEDGYLVTNAHVISYASFGENTLFDKIEVRFTTKEEYQSVTFVKMDVELDLAILKIDDDSIKYKPVSFSDEKYNYGDKVYAIGNTLNYGIGISEGIISVPEVKVTYNDISRLAIQADIDISSGNSGGALLNEKGKLIGITTFRTKDNQGDVNYGFAYSIPLKCVQKIIL